MIASSSMRSDAAITQGSRTARAWTKDVVGDTDRVTLGLDSSSALRSLPHYQELVRASFAPEIHLLLEAAGFREVEVEAAYANRPAAAGDDTLIFIARRSAEARRRYWAR